MDVQNIDFGRFLPLLGILAVVLAVIAVVAYAIFYYNSLKQLDSFKAVLKKKDDEAKAAKKQLDDALLEAKGLFGKKP